MAMKSSSGNSGQGAGDPSAEFYKAEAACQDVGDICRFCKHSLIAGATICAQCGQWQAPKKRNLEQWLGLSGAIVGLMSTLVLVSTFGRDRLFPPTPKLEITSLICLKKGFVVRIKNSGRAQDFAPMTAKEDMVLFNSRKERMANESKIRFEGLGLPLSLKSSTLIGPGRTEEVEYSLADPEANVQESPLENCRRELSFGEMGNVLCKDCTLQ